VADCDNVSVGVGVGGGLRRHGGGSRGCALFTTVDDNLLRWQRTTNSSQVGISTKSPNLQPKKIFALWKGFPPI